MASVNQIFTGANCWFILADSNVVAYTNDTDADLLLFLTDSFYYFLFPQIDSQYNQYIAFSILLSMYVICDAQKRI